MVDRPLGAVELVQHVVVLKISEPHDVAGFDQVIADPSESSVEFASDKYELRVEAPILRTSVDLRMEPALALEIDENGRQRPMKSPDLFRQRLQFSLPSLRQDSIGSGAGKLCDLSRCAKNAFERVPRANHSLLGFLDEVIDPLVDEALQKGLIRRKTRVQRTVHREVLLTKVASKQLVLSRGTKGFFNFCIVLFRLGVGKGGKQEEDGTDDGPPPETAVAGSPFPNSCHVYETNTVYRTREPLSHQTARIAASVIL